MIARFFAVFALLVWLPLAALAQDAPVAPDYAAWQRVAERAETAVEDNRASSEAFATLRAEIAEYRTRFLSAQATNAARIETVQGQLEALGPAPAEGESEPEEIAQRRAELNKQLTELRAPGIRAEEAFSRADGLIDEIDLILRARQTESLLTLGPSPLNPLYWGEAMTVLSGWLDRTVLEFRQILSSPAQLQLVQQRLPAVMGLVLVGLVALLRARRWSRRMAAFLMARARPQLQWVINSFVSGIGTVIAVAGISAVASGLLAAGLIAPRVEALATTLMWMAGWIWGAAWLAAVLFPDDALSRPFLGLSDQQTPAARRAMQGMGVAAALGAFAQLVLTTQVGVSPGAQSVITAVPIVLAAVFTLRFGQVLSRSGRGGAQDAPAEDAASSAYRLRLVISLGRVLMLLAVIAIAAKLLGYSLAADAVSYPLLLTVALLGGVLVVQRTIIDLYLSATGRDMAPVDDRAEAGAPPSVEDSTEGLVPVLISASVFIAALPLLALAWGARWSQLTELWAAFLTGVDLGGVRISPATMGTFLFVFLIGLAVTRVLQGTLRNTVLPKTRLDMGGRTAIVSGVGYVGIFLAALIAITTAGIDLSALAIVAGALSVGIGFGLQNIVSNFVSGIILLVERPVSEGDWVEVGGVMGTVRKISVRATTIETFDRTDVIVPNADLIATHVTNWTKTNLTGRLILTVGVAYGTDTRRVEKVLQEVAEMHPVVLLNPPPMIVFTGFGADSLDFEIRMILRDVNQTLRVKNEVNHLIAERFAKEGFEIPFAQRDVWLRNPEALPGGASRPAPATDGPKPEEQT